MSEFVYFSFIQGICEFLPISSSGHLHLWNHLQGHGALQLEWEVALHAGTLLAVVIYFWRDLWAMVGTVIACFHPGYRHNALASPFFKMALHLFIATLPALLIGFLFKKMNLEFSQLKLFAINSIIFGTLLVIVDAYFSCQRLKLHKLDAFFIGVAQSLAFIPGVSRSGICLTACRLLGIDRVTAVRFTFLLSVPTVLGALVLTAFDLSHSSLQLPIYTMISTAIITMMVGLLVIHVLLKFLQRYSLIPFGVYRILLGVILFWWGVV